ncbi:hypothetical protein CGK27_00040 [Vibrio parahaemolyticus]|nr:hypothetical protein CGK25_02805 [Vibrio parahaemolyticus]TOA65433.1 hypothetical protein CGK27_00040 [Vibrio parahaemolyticus]TOB00531.1 hypothetical protein CGK15_01690 [Vibrio parahaemolyticus]
MGRDDVSQIFGGLTKNSVKWQQVKKQNLKIRRIGGGYQELSSAWGLGCEQFSIFPASQISMVKKGEVKKRVDFFALFLIRPNRWVFPTI